MRARVLCLLSLAALLTGCEPVRVGIVVHSPHRVDATITATVGAADRELATAALRRLAVGDWDLRETAGAQTVRLEMRRALDPKVSPEVKVARFNGGFPWVRQSTKVSGELTLPPLQPEHLLSKVLADIPVELTVTLPGTVTAAKGGKTVGTNALFATKLSDVAGRKLTFEAESSGWRHLMVAIWLLVGFVLLWVLWPWIMPPPEVRARRREAAAARAAKRAAAREARAASQAERQAKNAELAAARAEKAAARAEKDAAKAAARAEKDAARQAAKQAAEAKVTAEAKDELDQAAKAAPPPKQRRGLLRRGKGQPAPALVEDTDPAPVAMPEPTAVGPEPDPEPEPTLAPEPAPDSQEPGEPSP